MERVLTVTPARRPHQDETDTHRTARRAKPTGVYGREVAHGAAAAPRRAPIPESTVPAKPNPPTPGRTTPGTPLLIN